MELHREFEEMLSELSDANARFMIVGAFAVAHHAEPRYTKDLDIWVDGTPENAQRVWRALARFGAPLECVSPRDFESPNTVYQIGVEPKRIDVMTSIDGVTFANAWRRRIRVDLGRLSVYYIGRNDLIRTKRAVGRPQDLLDVRVLSPKPRRPQKRRRRR